MKEIMKWFGAVLISCGVFGSAFVFAGCGATSEDDQALGQTEQPDLVDSTGYGLSGGTEGSSPGFNALNVNVQPRCAYFTLRGKSQCLVPNLRTAKTLFYGAKSVESPRGCPRYASENPELDASMNRVQTLLNNAAAAGNTGWTFHKTPARTSIAGWSTWFDCDEGINPAGSNSASGYLVDQLLPLGSGFPKLLPTSSNYYAMDDVTGDHSVLSYIDVADMKATATAHGQNWLDYLDHIVMIAVKAGAGLGTIGNHPTYFSSTDMFNPAKKTVVFSPQEICFLKTFDPANPANIFTVNACGSLQD